jgi:hypothetical protein
MGHARLAQRADVLQVLVGFLRQPDRVGLSIMADVGHPRGAVAVEAEVGKVLLELRVREGPAIDRRGSLVAAGRSQGEAEEGREDHSGLLRSSTRRNRSGGPEVNPQNSG